MSRDWWLVDGEMAAEMTAAYAAAFWRKLVTGESTPGEQASSTPVGIPNHPSPGCVTWASVGVGAGGLDPTRGVGFGILLGCLVTMCSHPWAWSCWDTWWPCAVSPGYGPVVTGGRTNLTHGNPPLLPCPNLGLFPPLPPGAPPARAPASAGEPSGWPMGMMLIMAAVQFLFYIGTKQIVAKQVETPFARGRAGGQGAGAFGRACAWLAG